MKRLGKKTDTAMATEKHKNSGTIDTQNWWIQISYKWRKLPTDQKQIIQKIKSLI